MAEYDNIWKALKLARQNRGGTFLVLPYKQDGLYSFIPVDWEDSGYYVSRPGGLENLPDNMFDVPFLQRYVGNIKPILEDAGNFLGIWQDSYGNWSLDVTMLYHDFNEALDAATYGGQRAIWDVANSRTILV